MYDAVIVGASIAGLHTGWKLAAAGWSVLIVDQRDTIGTPVRCGEATGNRAELGRFIPVDERWVASDIAGLAVHAGPSFTLSRRIPDTGVMLHRDRFECDLAARAAKAGAELRLSTRAVSLKRSDNGKYSLVLANGAMLGARVLIGADGAECRVGRGAGICRHLGLPETFSAAQYRLTSDFCNDGLLHFFVGRAIAPHGYIWVFPKGDGEISVGAGLYGGTRSGNSAIRLLDAFVSAHLPQCPRRALISGCAPVTVCPRRLCESNVVVVGDAARQVNPLTAGGIMNALEASDLLVRSLLAARDAPERGLANYSAKWRRQARFEQKVFLILQGVLMDSSDDDLVRMLASATRTLSGLADRSKPFRWPVGALIHLFVMVSRKAWRHTGILAR